MKQVFWFLCAIIVPVLYGGSLGSVVAQTSSPTPDPFVVQITSVPSSAFNLVIGDVSANGRFVVFVSNADIATERNSTRNNADGNREIFLYDYAQRRIFQITNTSNVLNPVTAPSPSPTPTPSPTPSPAPTPANPLLARIEIDNRGPMISLAPPLEDGQRTYRIVFSSNAPDPENFNGTAVENLPDNETNTEIWIYTLPPVADVDLSLGADIPFQDLTVGGSFDRIMETPASRPPRPGSTGSAPFFADDNREASISDDGEIVAFISTGGAGNTDRNPELFIYNVDDDALTQVTTTSDAVPGVGLIFQSNPNLSSDGSVVSFVSSANLQTTNNATNADNNAEIFIAEVGGSGLNNVRQVTRTVNGTFNAVVFNPGRRMSRNGALIALESRATDPKANATVSNQFLGMFVYSVSGDTFVEVGTRPNFDDVIRFPTFTDYNSSLAPSTLLFTSAVNFRPDGTLPTSAQASEGLNPSNESNVFVAPLPAASEGPFTRLSNTPNDSALGIRPIASESRRRVAFVMGAELGGGNVDTSNELFILLSPQTTSASSAVLSFFTGASNMPVTAATPVPSPSPSPTPTPSPVPGAPIALAPGELTIVRSTVPLAPSDRDACAEDPPLPCASETERAPALPVELNGVSVSVGGTAAGLYFVGDESQQINFVMPIGLAGGLRTVAVANNNTLLRGLVQITIAQPDIFTSTNDADGRAAAFNVTNPTARSTEPFSVTSPNSAGTSVPTVLELNVTGVRLAARTEITVTVGTTAITGDAIVSVQPNPEMPGFDIINFTLPASLAGAGDVPVQVTFTRGTGATAVTTVSRPAATAPNITIN